MQNTMKPSLLTQRRSELHYENMPCIILILHESQSYPNDYSCKKCHMSMNQIHMHIMFDNFSPTMKDHMTK